jgi:hypothetical protein
MMYLALVCSVIAMLIGVVLLMRGTTPTHTSVVRWYRIDQAPYIPAGWHRVCFGGRTVGIAEWCPSERRWRNENGSPVEPDEVAAFPKV